MICLSCHAQPSHVPCSHSCLVLPHPPRSLLLFFLSLSCSSSSPHLHLHLIPHLRLRAESSTSLAHPYASPLTLLLLHHLSFGSEFDLPDSDFLPEYRMHIYSESFSFYPACRYRPVPCFPHRCCSFGVRCDEHAHAKMNPRTRHISPFSASHRLPLSSCLPPP